MPLSRSPMPRTAGILTFIRARTARVEDLTEGMVAVAGVPYDLSTTSRIGARFGPRAYRETSNYYAGSAYSEPSKKKGSGSVDLERRETVTDDRLRDKLRDIGNLRVFPIDWDKTQSSLRESMYQITRKGALPIILGGDRFISYPLVRGFRDALLKRGGKRVGYIQFSSQLDLGDEDPVWGRVWRGATARRILDGGIVDRKNMVWVGTNGYVRTEQWELAQDMGVKVLTLSDIRRQGIAAVVAEAAEIAGDGCDAIYLSVDLDVLDGGYVAGTAAPSFDGIRNIDLWKAIDILTRTKVGAMDLCGLNPVVEVEGQGKTGQRFGVHLVLRFIYPRVMDYV